MTGSLPSLLHEANQKGWRPTHLLLGIAVIIFCLLAVNLSQRLQPQPLNLSLTLPIAFLSGFILGLGSIIPGLSGGFILISLGVYQALTNATTQFEFTILVPVAIGALFAIITFSRLITWLLKQFYTTIYYIFIGITITSMILAWPPLPPAFTGVLVIFFFLLGSIGGYFLNRQG
jgi:putative membrane protein